MRRRQKQAEDKKEETEVVIEDYQRRLPAHSRHLRTRQRLNAASKKTTDVSIWVCSVAVVVVDADESDAVACQKQHHHQRPASPDRHSKGLTTKRGNRPERDPCGKKRAIWRRGRRPHTKSFRRWRLSLRLARN